MDFSGSIPSVADIADALDKAEEKVNAQLFSISVYGHAERTMIFHARC